ncbi:MAG: hypothetical protein J6M06_01130 [Synergistaceae bacterium]|nr:hypothetical protein [Synergistaceae bacterium]
MKKLAVVVATAIAVFLCVSCQQGRKAEAPSDVESNISEADISGMKAALQSAVDGNPIVSVIDNKGKMSISISYDPIILRYELGAALAAAVEVVRERLDDSDIELNQLDVMGFFYEQGERTNQISFGTTDMESGIFSDTEKGIFGKATIQEALELCGYSKSSK